MSRFLHSVRLTALGVLAGGLISVGFCYFVLSQPNTANAGLMGDPINPNTQVITNGLYPWINEPGWLDKHYRLLVCVNLGHGTWLNNDGVNTCADDLEEYTTRLREFTAQEKAEK